MILSGDLRLELASSDSPADPAVSNGPSRHLVNHCRKVNRMEQMLPPYLHICFMACTALVR